MAIKRPGTYVALATNYADDEAIMDAGEYAELMYVRILAFCGRTPKTEGWISDKQIRTRLGLELVPEVGPETAPEKRAERLAEVGLLTRERDGYRVSAWLKWNRSAEEISRTRGQDRDRKNAVTSTDTGNGTGKRTGNGTGTDTGSSHSESESESESDVPRKRAHQRPTDWQPNDQHRKFASENGVFMAHELEQFKDHHDAKGSKFKDWDAAFRTWLRNSVKFSGGGLRVVSETTERPPQQPDPNAWMRRRPASPDDIA